MLLVKKLKKLLLSTTIIFIMVFNVWCGLGVKSANAATMQFGESQITLNNADQLNPDIYQYGLNHFAVVWQDNRNGNWDIYMYYQNYLGNGNWDVRYDAQITANSGNNMSPKIYDDAIVYQSDRNGNWDIYMYNLTSKVESQITTNTANQGPCAIYGDIIVWQDWRNMWRPSIYLETYPGMDIYMYNLTSQTEEPLPLPETACFSPAISGDQVVYIAENYYKSPSTGITEYYSYVCAYNLSTGLSFVVAAGQWNIVPYSGQPRAMSSPAVDESISTWTEYSRTSGVWNVVVKNITTGVSWRSGNTDGPYQTDVSGKFVAYQGIINGNWDIYLYDFTSNSPYDATNNAARQENPAISATEYANFIVYQDNRNGNWDIYLSAFWYGAMGGGPSSHVPITPSYVIDQLQETKSRIMDTPTSDFAGANDKVKENRKNAMLHQFDSAIANIEAAANTQNLKLRIKYFQSAIDQLNGLINKLDGWSLERGADMPGSGFTPDWITAAQYLDQVPRACRNDLQTLINGIT
jgi:beta propeller repeat protein